MPWGIHGGHSDRRIFILPWMPEERNNTYLLVDAVSLTMRKLVVERLCMGR